MNLEPAFRFFSCCPTLCAIQHDQTSFLYVCSRFQLERHLLSKIFPKRSVANLDNFSYSTSFLFASPRLFLPYSDDCATYKGNALAFSSFTKYIGKTVKTCHLSATCRLGLPPENCCLRFQPIRHTYLGKTAISTNMEWPHRVSSPSPLIGIARCTFQF